MERFTPLDALILPKFSRGVHMRKMKERNHIGQIARLLGLLAMSILAEGCSSRHDPQPAIQITRVPAADPGGPQKLDLIEGSVRGTKAGEQIVLYAHSGAWWVQPFTAHPLTNILPDGTWRNSTHLGTEYAALLVDSSYRPPSKIESLPVIGNGVIAVATVKGKETTVIAQKTVHFSGYDWIVRRASSSRGGETNDYDPENAWLDKNGFLHLRMGERNGKWSCAEVSLPRSLGYGTYRFVVQDTASLIPSAVVGLFTWDEVASVGFRNELDIELSRWGNPKSKNAQYVVQPFYVPENIVRFMVPSGTVTHTFRWEPSKVSFESVQGAGHNVGAKSFSEHVFTSGIPTPANETIHLNLYDYYHSKNSSQQPSEVVIEKFEYLP